jgi:hypothetical protein
MTMPIATSAGRARMKRMSKGIGTVCPGYALCATSNTRFAETVRSDTPELHKCRGCERVGRLYTRHFVVSLTVQK